MISGGLGLVAQQWDRDYPAGSVLKSQESGWGGKQAQPGGPAWHVSILGLVPMLA